jgi:hypothetical protein
MTVSARDVDGPMFPGTCTKVLFQLFDSMLRLSPGRQSRIKTEKRPNEA